MEEGGQGGGGESGWSVDGGAVSPCCSLMKSLLATNTKSIQTGREEEEEQEEEEEEDEEVEDEQEEEEKEED